MRTLAVVALVLASCTPAAKVPSPTQAAVAAINLTDEALATAITLAPPGEDAAWTRRVILLERAAAVVRVGANACPAIDDVATIAAEIKCTQCAALAATAREIMKCAP